MLHSMVALFDGIDIRDLLTLSEQQRQHVALVLHETSCRLTGRG